VTRGPDHVVFRPNTQIGAAIAELAAVS